MTLLNNLLLYYGSPGYKSPEERFWINVFLVVILVIAVVFIVYRSYMSRHDDEWDEGIIPKSFKPTEKNIFEIFIAASGAIVVRDLDNYYIKFPYIDKFLYRNFKEVYYSATESYGYSMRHVVKIDSLATWSNTHLSKEWKVKMINFLAGIASYDGGINDGEQRYLLALMSRLRLDLTDFEAGYQEKITRQNERRHQAEPSSSRLDFFYRVLGLEKNASIEEVKATYRRLVKLTHPDRFMNESPEVQKQMSEKFQEIQIAYESIVNS
jgi:hypothetical protein